jgi:DNA-binding transcriptional regulator YdaS (Cro superfamily)
MSSSTVIAQALERAGGYAAVAKALNLNPEAVRLWRSRGRVPAERVVDLERLTGVPREQLRPDLYRLPDPSHRGAA